MSSRTVGTFGRLHLAAAFVVAGIAGSGAASPSAATPAEGLLPLVRPDRVLHYRGRSSMSVSRPDERPRPSVGHVFSTLVHAGEMEGRWVMLVTSFPYSDDAATSAGLSAPRERRREQILLAPDSFTLEVIERTSEAYRSRDRWGPPAALRFTSDGFGLNRAARLAAGLWTLAVPADVLRRLTSDGEIRRAYDFFLTIEDPLADRTVTPAVSGSGPPPGAETRVSGVTRLRLEGADEYPVDRRWPAPALQADAPAPPPLGRRDVRVRLPALRVRVEVDLTVERLRGAGEFRLTRRRDRATWTVLNRMDAPWLLAQEGLVTSESGDPRDPDLREASFSRELVRIEERRRP